MATIDAILADIDSALSAHDALRAHARLPQVEPFEVLDFDPFDQVPTHVIFDANICENV